MVLSLDYIQQLASGNEGVDVEFKDTYDRGGTTSLRAIGCYPSKIHKAE